MHELGIAQEVVALVAEHAQRQGHARRARDRQAVGHLCPTRSGSVSTCAARGPWSRGAQLEIIEIPGRARCRDLRRRGLLERPFGRCECGGTDLEWLAGEELRVKEYEVSDV